MNLVVLLDNSGEKQKAHYTKRLKHQLQTIIQKYTGCTLRVIRYGQDIHMDTNDTVRLVVIGGSFAIPRRHCQQTLWNIDMLKRWPSAHVFGVCFGMQLIGYIHGSKIVSVPEKKLRKGVRTIVGQSCKGVYANMFLNTHNSFCVEVAHRHRIQQVNEAEFYLLAKSADGTPMAIQKRRNSARDPLVLGVQYHPEGEGSHPGGFCLLKKVLYFCIQN